MPAPIDDRKGGVLARVEFPDHLQHQQLVEIGIEQAAHDRIEPPAMIVGPGRDVCDCHAETISRPRLPNQWLSAWWVFCGGMAGQRLIGFLACLTAACTPVQAGWFGANCCRR